MERGITLLSDDKRLRNVAVIEGVIVRGTIWILNELLKLGKITNKRYRDCLIKLKYNIGILRLSVKEIDSRLMK